MSLPIDIGDIRHEALSVSIHAEINRQRALRDLAALNFDPAAYKAASLHARSMVEQDFYGHVDPADPDRSTAMERLRQLHLRPLLAVENIGRIPTVRYRVGDTYFKRTEGRRSIVSESPDGPPFPPHSYASLTDAVVEEWMHSPAHRDHLLNPEVLRAGAACQLAGRHGDFDFFYCVWTAFR